MYLKYKTEKYVPEAHHANNAQLDSMVLSCSLCTHCNFLRNLKKNMISDEYAVLYILVMTYHSDTKSSGISTGPG